MWKRIHHSWPFFRYKNFTDWKLFLFFIVTFWGCNPILTIFDTFWWFFLWYLMMLIFTNLWLSRTVKIPNNFQCCLLREGALWFCWCSHFCIKLNYSFKVLSVWFLHKLISILSFLGPIRGIDFHQHQPLFVSGGDDYKIKVGEYY